jgi:deferrochelatase/peroxidase EfeB
VTKQLDLLDIQGNVIRAYGRFGYPVARYVLINFRRNSTARSIVNEMTARVTTAVEWGRGDGQIPQPDWTLNLAFTYLGLKILELPRASLVGFSPEFVEGMKARKDILGDDGPSSPDKWDPVWQKHRNDAHSDIHMLVTLNARTPALLEESYAWMQTILKPYGEQVSVLKGHRGDDGVLMDYQDVHVLPDPETGKPSPKEHFGYTDGIGDPVFEGAPAYDLNVDGRGKQMPDGTWAALATGEFLLGHIDEAKEYPPAPLPILLSRNGTYMVYRKLHENVATFERYLDEHGKKYPGGRELLAAKFVGRWRDNGAPLVAAPDAQAKAKFDAEFYASDKAKQDQMLSNFTYDEDMSGSRCPFSSHIRRINPRASLQMMRGDKAGEMQMSTEAFDTPGALTNRRRLLRRGLPYGQVKDRTRDDGNHGIVIMMINADINRQFEFVQQQWINYGNDFQASSEKEILLGNHSEHEKFPSKAVLQVDPNSDDAPYFLSKIPRLVEMRGGEYFFIPSMTALRMMAKGIIDPT